MTLTMPWQHWLVLAELWMSFVLLAAMIARGWLQYGGARWLWLPWDLAFLGLFLWGLNGVNTAAYIYLFFTGLGFSRQIQHNLERKREVWKVHQRFSMVIAVALFSLVPTTLVVLS